MASSRGFCLLLLVLAAILSLEFSDRRGFKKFYASGGPWNFVQDHVQDGRILLEDTVAGAPSSQAPMQTPIDSVSTPAIPSSGAPQPATGAFTTSSPPSPSASTPLSSSSPQSLARSPAIAPVTSPALGNSAPPPLAKSTKISPVPALSVGIAPSSFPPPPVLLSPPPTVSPSPVESPPSPVPLSPSTTAESPSPVPSSRSPPSFGKPPLLAPVASPVAPPSTTPPPTKSPPLLAPVASPVAPPSTTPPPTKSPPSAATVSTPPPAKSPPSAATVSTPPPPSAATVSTPPPAKSPPSAATVSTPPPATTPPASPPSSPPPAALSTPPSSAPSSSQAPISQHVSPPREAPSSPSSTAQSPLLAPASPVIEAPAPVDNHATSPLPSPAKSSASPPSAKRSAQSPANSSALPPAAKTLAPSSAKSSAPPPAAKSLAPSPAKSLPPTTSSAPPPSSPSQSSRKSSAPPPALSPPKSSPSPTSSPSPPPKAQLPARIPSPATRAPEPSATSLPLKNAPRSPGLPASARTQSPTNSPRPSANPALAPVPGSRSPPPHPATIFFPPPPNSDCHKTCIDPYVTTLPGEPCDCVIPMRVGLILGIPLFGLLPLVSEFATELAAGTFLSQRQVQISAANAIGVDLDNTALKASLIPVQRFFDNKTALRIAERLWTHRVYINRTLFGNYTVSYIQYPGLPSFYSGGVSTATVQQPGGISFPEQPLAVDVSPPSRRSKKFGTGIVIAITVTSAIVILACIGLMWFLVVRQRSRNRAYSLPPLGASPDESSITKRTTTRLSSSSDSSTFLSFASNFPSYAGSVTTFSFSTIEKATENFNPANIVGEGGFGRVYAGILENDTKIAVKVLIRDDQQGDKEFAAEVEMLSRLHHRNLVTLVGICTEEMRCLVYELISNGSVECHLHGGERPLSWEARIKIALGSARALAYLHEDCYPRVIHRDFKSSNILLEDDFTPKVSDFGLAKAASEELTGHISTRVMGTFGYVAPEYAMTGHLLVKSDVYSYGVVLLELLSGRRPVDMSRSPGQENLVTWARPLLSSSEGLQMLMDPTLQGQVSLENLARVAAIASMCVQPEVSQRPFMGEVVQALKLVCNDGSEDMEVSSRVSNEHTNDWNELLLDDEESHMRATCASVSDTSSSSTLLYIQGLPNDLNAQNQQE